eukprot:2811642-Pyramimonas_sp.AAC.1
MFYEHIGHEHLFEAAPRFNFPIWLLRCLCAIYACPCVLLYGGAVSRAVRATRSVAAGCGGAARRRVLRSCFLGGPQLMVRNVVGDIALRVCSGKEQVAQVPGEEVESLLTDFDRPSLPVEVSKTKYICSQEVSRYFRDQWRIPSSSRVSSARNLGTKASSGSSRPVGIARGRFVAAKSRGQRLQILQSAGADASRIQR